MNTTLQGMIDPTVTSKSSHEQIVQWCIEIADTDFFFTVFYAKYWRLAYQKIAPEAPSTNMV